MRPRSRFALPAFTAILLALSAASIAGAETATQDVSLDSAKFHSITNAAFDEAFESMASRVDERLSVALAGPTTMDCSTSAESGLETCVVRTAGPSAAPAALAQN